MDKIQYTLDKSMDSADVLLEYLHNIECEACNNTRTILRYTYEVFPCDLVLEDHKCGPIYDIDYIDNYKIKSIELRTERCELSEFIRNVAFKFFLKIFSGDHYHIDELLYWRFFNNAIMRIKSGQKLDEYAKYCYCEEHGIYDPQENKTIYDMLEKEFICKQCIRQNV